MIRVAPLQRQLRFSDLDSNSRDGFFPKSKMFPFRHFRFLRAAVPFYIDLTVGTLEPTG
jgi:hypothetical protein